MYPIRFILISTDKYRAVFDAFLIYKVRPTIVCKGTTFFGIMQINLAFSDRENKKRSLRAFFVGEWLIAD